MLILYFFTAFIGCFFGTLAGGGAGLILQPIFILAGLPYVQALASSKLAVGLIGVASSLVYFRSGMLDWKVFWLCSLYGLPFVILGTFYSDNLPSGLMNIILAGFILFLVLINFLTKLGLREHAPTLTRTRILLSLLIMPPIAFYNGWLSAGSGVFLTLMFIILFRYDQRHAIAMTVSSCGLFWNIVGAVGHVWLGHVQWDLAPSLMIGAFLGSYCGARFSLGRGNRFMKNVFLIVAGITAVILLLR